MKAVDKFYYRKNKNLILDAINELEEENEITTSNFTETYNRNYEDVEKDIHKLIVKLKKSNLDLYSFIKMYEDEVFNDEEFITTNNSFLNFILYSYDKQKGILGLKLLDSSDIEYLYKYNYGYYQYDMGKRFILQSFDSLKEYYKATAEKLLIGILTPDYADTNIGNVELIEKREAINIAKKCSLVKKYGDGYTIYVHIGSLIVELVKYGINLTIWENYDAFVTDFKDDLGNIPHRIFNGMAEIFIGYRNHPISLREFDEIKKKLETSEKNNKLLVPFGEVMKNVNKYNL